MRTLKRHDTFASVTEKLQFRLATKAGVASALSLFLGVGFSQVTSRPDTLVNGLFAVITSIVVVQAYLGGTYRAAWIRFLGTFVGAIIGGGCASLFGMGAFSLGVSIFLTVVILSALGLHDSLRIASLTVAFVMVLWGVKPDISPWAFGAYRLVDSCIGILVAVVVVHTLWPTQATRKVRLNLVHILRCLQGLYSACMHTHASQQHQKKIFEKQMRDVVDSLRQTRSVLEESRIEIRTRSSMQDWTFLLDRLEAVYDNIALLRQVDQEHLRTLFDDSLKTSVLAINQETSKAFTTCKNFRDKKGA